MLTQSQLQSLASQIHGCEEFGGPTLRKILLPALADIYDEALDSLDGKAWADNLEEAHQNNPYRGYHLKEFDA